MIIPEKLKIGDTIGVIAPSSPIIGDNVEELNQAKKIIENLGFKVKYSKNIFSNTNNYSATAKEKADDINEMFADKDIKMIWCAKGGNNSNSTFEYINYDNIKRNPKIICGFSDITSLTNMITEKTGLITFSGTNFKTVATDETDYSLKEALKDKVVDVKVSNRLKSHPVCLVSDQGVSFEMEKVLNAMPDGQDVKAGRILEINPNHDIFKAIQNVYQNNADKINDYASLLFDQALLTEGLSIEDPVAFSNKICELMIELNK